MRRPQLVHHPRRLVGQVVGEVVAVGILLDVEVMVVCVEPVGMVEVGEGVEDPVVAVEAPLQGQLALGAPSLRWESLVRCHFPSMNVAQPASRNVSDMVTRVVAQLVAVTREPGVAVGHLTHAGHVVVEPGQQRRPSRRAHRVDVEVGVAQALGREPVQFRCLDLGPIAAEIGVAEVVGHHHDHVRRPLAAGSPARASGARMWRRSCRRALKTRVRRGRGPLRRGSRPPRRL